MNLKTFNPITPSQRHLIKLKKINILKKPLIKNRISGIKNCVGKNFKGHTVSYHKGGGHKKNYRKVNFLRTTSNIGIIMSLEYDPFRTAIIASVFIFGTNSFEYILATKNLKVGDIVKSGINISIKNANSLPLYKIPAGSLLHNISLKNNKGSIISRAAGTFSRLVQKTSYFGKIQLSSGKYKYIPIKCYATIGIISNEKHFLTTKGKAGRSRWLNIRPTVRGVAMNPVDHPHGGGEGKTSGGRPSVTPWGKPTK